MAVILPDQANTKTKRALTITPSYKLLSVLLLLAIVGMLVAWKPWQPNIKASDRIISVTGETTISATPDEYVFSPSYAFDVTDSKTALAQLTAKSDEIVSHLKSIGVPSTAIKTSSNGNSSGYSGGGGFDHPLILTPNGSSKSYTLSLTVTLDSNKLVQTVQDYLLSTNPTGEVSPTVTFSAAKQKSLQSQARTAAEKDARTKADQSAKNLGFKVTSVKTVEDGSLGGPILYDAATADGVNSAVTKAPSLSVQPGQNELSYSVSIVYYIR